MSAAGVDGADAPRARGPYRTGLRRRQQILDTSVEVFGRYGYRSGSLRQIAEIVGVTPAALIRHFGTKEELLAAVLEQSDRDNSSRLDAQAEGMSLIESFAAVARRNVDNRGMVELLLTVAAEASDPAHPANPYIRRRYADLVTRLAEQLRAARAAGEIRPLTDAEIEIEARGLVALMDGLELQWLLEPSLGLAAAADHLFARTFERLRSRPAG